jgi:hypothetical protein
MLFQAYWRELPPKNAVAFQPSSYFSKAKLHCFVYRSLSGGELAK